MKLLKGLITRNTHVKYQCYRTHCSKVISKVKVFFKIWVKLQGQGHSVKNNGARGKGLITRNTHVKYKSYSTHCSNVISKVKEIPRSRSQGKKVPTERSYHRVYSCEISKL